MTGGPAIDILLGTYNGAPYLEEQLASLTAQSFTDWRLILRDDGSRDNSVEIVREWAKRTGANLLVIEDGEPGQGACGNFARLLAVSDAPYFSFCDQDDVWLPNKLERLLAAVRGAETAERHEPVLAFCDLIPVDNALNPIAPSFRAFSNLRIPPEHMLARHTLVQNVVTGCAMLGNGALRKKSVPVSDTAMMHDWWVSLVAVTMGRQIDVPEPLILYRQHGGNTLGARRGSLLHNVQRFLGKPGENWAWIQKWVGGTIRQAAAFEESFGDQMKEEDRQLFAKFGRLRQKNLIARKTFAFRQRLYTNSLVRIAAIAVAV